jgi:hypothetical protein
MLEWRIGSAFGAAVPLEHVQRIDSELDLLAGTWARFELWEKQAAGDVDDALRRRYAVPFAATNGAIDITKVPDKVKKWVGMLLDTRLLDARREAGVVSADDSNISKLKDEANAEMAKAADATKRRCQNFHYDLIFRHRRPRSLADRFVLQAIQYKDISTSNNAFEMTRAGNVNQRN